MFERMSFVYARYGGMKQFRAFDLNGCFTVDRLIYATLIENSEENRIKLQKLASMNKANTISPLSTCYSLIADEKQRADLEHCIKRRFQQLTKQDLKWMRKNYGNAMKFIVRQFEENGVLTY